MKQAKILCLCLICFIFVRHIYAHDETVETVQKDRTDVILGFGSIISPDYGNVLRDTYPSYEFFFGWGWLDFQIGVRFKTNEKFSITPAVDLMVNYVSMQSFGNSDLFFNTIIVPSVSGCYAFTRVYLRGEVNYGFFNSDVINAESSGVGFGAAIGYDTGNMGYELGYLYVPVKTYFGDKNFGGILIKFFSSF